jgi:hypothetical protein
VRKLSYAEGQNNDPLEDIAIALALRYGPHTRQRGHLVYRYRKQLTSQIKRGLAHSEPQPISDGYTISLERSGVKTLVRANLMLYKS